jgi:hypothetical protein
MLDKMLVYNFDEIDFQIEEFSLQSNVLDNNPRQVKKHTNIRCYNTSTCASDTNIVHKA